MAKNYYYVVSSLVEHSLESSPKGFDAAALRDEIAGQVDAKGREYIKLLYTFYDIENLISRYNGKTTYNPLGNLSPDELEDAEKGSLAATGDGDTLPWFLQSVVDAYRDGTEADDGIDIAKSYEKNLWEAYYAECEKSDCRFIREYMRFDRTLRNISAAFVARRTGLPIAPYLVGSDEITNALSHSSASDFGLRGEITYVESVISLLEEENILEKEQEFDEIRWKEIEEITVFDYFTIDKLLAYLAKANIIQRWVSLNREVGQKMLERMLGELSDRDILARAESGETN